MLPRNRWFIAAALAYALLGGLLALAWLAFPTAMPAYALRAHAHLMLMGFLGMVIFGVGLHVLPRFTAAPIRGGWLGWLQQGFAHAGTVLLVAGLAAGQRPVAVVGGSLAWVAIAVFAVRLAPVLRQARG